jgi:hypothetical protein
MNDPMSDAYWLKVQDERVAELEEALMQIAHWRGEFQVADAGRMREIARSVLGMRDVTNGKVQE